MDYNSNYEGQEVQDILDSVAGKYVKPSTGIPASDLAPDVFLQGDKGDKGDKGDTGATGPQGPQGVSVTSVAQTTTSSSDGGSNVVTVTLSDGKTSTFTVKNGSKGSQGEKGDKGDTGATGANGTNGKDGADGEDGATFTPSVDTDGNLSWTNNKGLSNPPTVNIKGPKGDSGEGGGSGEDNMFFTDFTLPDYIRCAKNYSYLQSDIPSFAAAVRSNKLICVPLGSEYSAGYIIAQCALTESEEYSILSCSINFNGADYNAYSEDGTSLLGEGVVNFSPQTVSIRDTDAVIEEALNNTTYVCTNIIDSLTIHQCIGTSRVLFIAGESFSFEIYFPVFWANGVVPEIEADNFYELSLSVEFDAVLAVLTPFKSVE